LIAQQQLGNADVIMTTVQIKTVQLPVAQYDCLLQLQPVQPAWPTGIRYRGRLTGAGLRQGNVPVICYLPALFALLLQLQADTVHFNTTEDGLMPEQRSADIQFGFQQTDLHTVVTTDADTSDGQPGRQQ